MKLILLFAALLLGVWLWRAGRRARLKDHGQRNQPPAPTQTEMVPCLHCSVHIAQAEAIKGKLGPYCSTDHRQLAEP